MLSGGKVSAIPRARIEALRTTFLGAEGDVEDVGATSARRRESGGGASFLNATSIK